MTASGNLIVRALAHGRSAEDARASDLTGAPPEMYGAHGPNMRIAFISTSYPPDLGGIQLVIRELAERMVSRGHQVEVLTHASRLAPPGVAEQAGVVVHRFEVPIPSKDFPVSPALFRGLVRRRRGFDIAHAHNFHALPPLLAAVARMRPLVFSPHYHGGGHSNAARVAHVAYRPATRILFRACSHIVCVSSAEADALQRGVPYLRTPLTVIPNGVSVDAFREAEPFESPAGVVLAAGRMESYKQFDRIVRAAERLPEDQTVVLVGDGPERASLDALIAERGLAGRVRTVGRVSDDDLHRWFRTARVLVTMSRHESFGLTVLEALAAGAAAVASDIPAHRELAADQPTGAVTLVSPDASPGEIAEAIAAASRDGRPDGVRLMSWDDVTTATLEVYESARA